MLLQQHIEEAGLNAWAPLQQMLFDGWVLRFANGYTKRANSINPVYATSRDLGEKIVACETLYRDRGLPVIFRLTSFGPSPELDVILAQRGYRQIDLSWAMHVDLNGLNLSHAPILRETTLDDWIELYRALSGEADTLHDDTHRAILRTIPSRCCYMLLVDAGQVVSCGLGVLEQGYFGLFNLVTSTEHRNQGYGMRLVAGMLAWAKARGAAHGYLQVMDNNAPARHVYAKAGFQDCYSYWYRVAPESAGA